MVRSLWLLFHDFRFQNFSFSQRSHGPPLTVRHRTADSTASTSKIPNVYGPQDDRTGKRAPGPRQPVAAWVSSMIGAFRIIPHNSTSFHLFLFCAPKGAASRLISAFQDVSSAVPWHTLGTAPARAWHGLKVQKTSVNRALARCHALITPPPGKNELAQIRHPAQRFRLSSRRAAAPSQRVGFRTSGFGLLPSTVIYTYLHLSTPKNRATLRAWQLQIGADSSSQRSPATPDSSRSATFHLELSAPICTHLHRKRVFPIRPGFLLSAFDFLFSNAASFPISDF